MSGPGSYAMMYLIRNRAFDSWQKAMWSTSEVIDQDWQFFSLSESRWAHWKRKHKIVDTWNSSTLGGLTSWRSRDGSLLLGGSTFNHGRELVSSNHTKIGCFYPCTGTWFPYVFLFSKEKRTRKLEIQTWIVLGLKPKSFSGLLVCNDKFVPWLWGWMGGKMFSVF